MSALRPIEIVRVAPASAVAAVQVSVDPTTGSASGRIPIPLTAGRDGFGPSLSLVHGGHDPLSSFAHDWSLAGLPAIDVDVRDGLPEYGGRERYRYAGQELVPLEGVGRTSSWARTDHDVRAFRARVESTPIRAEQWTHQTTGRVHWRVRMGDGSVQVFGRSDDGSSRIADPSDSSRTFRWLLESAFDRLGNAMVVRYAAEDAAGVDPLGLDAGRFVGATAHRHPKRILYGNASPLAEDTDASTAEWHFEAVFDYGDHDPAEPTPVPSGVWALRQDASFVGRLGFEIRSRRLCRRVLVFHRFPSELGEPATLVGSFELAHAEAPDATTLTGVRYVGWRTEGGARVSQATPWATLVYTDADAADAFDVREVPLLGPDTQLVDLLGEGLSGLLSSSQGVVHYARNLGEGGFGAYEVVPEWPVGLSSAVLADFDRDGNVELLQPTGAQAGYYRLDRRTRRWECLQRFDTALNVEPGQGAVFQADMSGDGRADVVLVHATGVTWFPNRGVRGFGEPVEVRLPAERVPVANAMLRRFVADMTGDGLADIVEVQNGSVRYWPNLGRGRFGDPVVMDGAPRLDAPDAYDPARVLLIDLDQTGASDLVYLRGDGLVTRASNRRGTAFGPLESIAWGPTIPNGAHIEIADVDGDGSSSLVMVAPSATGTAAFHTLRLVSSPGARQIQSVSHALGAVSEIEWGHSVRHYLRDASTGRDWDTPLPAQRPVVDALRYVEPIDGAERSERYRYHDGHYDPRERSFGLFAVVDHLDVDVEEPVADVIPLLTRRFSHTGDTDYTARFERRRYGGDSGAPAPPESTIEDREGLLDRDLDEAHGALHGATVREEVYATDPAGVHGPHPFRVVSTSRSVALTRAADDRYRTAVQLVPRETHACEYEQDPTDPRVTIQRVLDVDEYLTPALAMQAGLPRRAGTGSRRFAAQERTLAVASTSQVLHVDTNERFELAIPIESRTYEVHLSDPAAVFADDLADELATGLPAAYAYDEPLDPDGASPAARELTHARTFYWNETRTAALALGSVGAVTLPHHTEQAAYDRGQLATVLGTRVDPDLDLPSLGYVASGDVFYQRGPLARFGDASSFYRLEETESYDGGIREIVSDAHHLVAIEMIDPVGNMIGADVDYHLLAPFRITDPNGTVQEVDYDPLGVIRRTSRYGSALDATSALVAHGFTALTFGQARPSFAAALADPEAALGTVESVLLYEYPSAGAPMRTLTLAAEELAHRGPDAGSAAARAQASLTYFDGSGRELQSRALVEPGIAWTVDPGTGALIEAPVTTRWRVSGHVELDAKQQPREQYEPFFRDEHAFEPAIARRRIGVATSTEYDALGRAVRQDFANGTFSETAFESWSRTSLDPNDSVDQATDYVAARQSLGTTNPERIALEQALSNVSTPISVHVDPLGRELASVERIESNVDLVEEARLDIRGLSEATIDRRGLTASTRSFDRLGRMLAETSIDAGTRRSLSDAEGRAVKTWHEDTEERHVFDLAGRQIERHVTDGTTSWLAERVTYGESATGAADRNQLGRIVRVDDCAGRHETTRYGAFGEPLEVMRTLVASPGTDPDWSSSVALDATSHATRAAFDALGRRTRAFLPDDTERRVEYLRSGPAAKLQVVTPDATVRTILAAAEYNARGQQTHVELGNGVDVASTYDAETFRLHRRHATLGATTYQDLRHHYDPVGNLVHVDDLAQRPSATHVVDGLTVTAERVFHYDARYQLTAATGRVHNALTRSDFRGDVPNAGSFRGTRRVGLNDGGAVTRYQRSYDYDHAGNLLGWDHGPEGAGSGNSWTNEKWVSSSSNRSYLAYDLNGVAITDPASKFDARGQITSLPNVRSMEWSVRNQLRRVVLVERTTDPDDDELYDYAADGKRLRKTTRRLVSGNVETTETIYLDECELRRVTQSSTVILERWSSHVADGDTRHATLYRWDTDDQARETSNTGVVRTHYHLGANLGSVSLEVGPAGEVLAYEEYFPYGGTAFLAGDSVIDIAFRTLRYVGKDQDDATGFYVFQFRYYAPFVGNWVSPDPVGEIDGPNLYVYCRNNPVSLADALGLIAGPERHAPDPELQSRGPRVGTTAPSPGEPPTPVPATSTPEPPRRGGGAGRRGMGDGRGRGGEGPSPTTGQELDLFEFPTEGGTPMPSGGSQGTISGPGVPDGSVAAPEGDLDAEGPAPQPTLPELPPETTCGELDQYLGYCRPPSETEAIREPTAGEVPDIASPETTTGDPAVTGLADSSAETSSPPLANEPDTGDRDAQVAEQLRERAIEYQAERHARAEAVLGALPDILSFGLWSRTLEVVERVREIWHDVEARDWGEAAWDVAALGFRYTPLGELWHFGSQIGAGAGAVYNAWHDLDSPDPRTRGEAAGQIEAIPITAVLGAGYGGGLAGPGTFEPTPGRSRADRRVAAAEEALDAEAAASVAVDGPHTIDVDTLRSTASDLDRALPGFDEDILNDAIRPGLERRGVELLMNEEAEAYLAQRGAGGSYIPHEGGGTIVLPRDPSRVALIEEIVHADQHRRAGLPAQWGPTIPDPRLRSAQIALIEMEAQERLIALGTSPNSLIRWTEAELQQLTWARNYWRQKWRELGGRVH